MGSAAHLPAGVSQGDHGHVTHPSVAAEGVSGSEQHRKGRPGRASSLFSSAQGLAQISGNWIGGPLAEALGFRALFALAAATVLCGTVYTFRVLGHPHPVEERS